MRSLRAGACVLLLVALVLAPTSGARASTTIRRGVLGNGGRLATGGGRMLVGTVGQASIGMNAGSGRNLCAGFWCSGISAFVSVENPDAPAELAFAGPVPNPAEGAVRLAIALPGPSRVGLAVFDAAGRRIKELANHSMGAGRHAWTWDLRGDAGERVRAGVYFARLVVDDRVVGNRRIVVVR